MVERLVNEIFKCLDNDCYLSALDVALTLPDICGKAEYPSEKSTRDRYIKWFDKYIGQYEQSQWGKNHDVQFINGALTYDLRCSLLHQGNPNVDCKKQGLQYFELVASKTGRGCMFSSARIIEYGSEDEIVSKRISIGINELCFKICKCAQNYYIENSEKFNFFNFNLVDTDMLTKQLFFTEKM